MNKTRKNLGRGIATRGWKKEKPGYSQKTVMLRKCGRKCFLGPGKSFPICKKNTCRSTQNQQNNHWLRPSIWKKQIC